MVVFLCSFYILLNLFVGLNGVREWPFTDYPMFSWVHYENETVSVLRFQILRKDGSHDLLGRSFANGYGSGESNLAKLVADKKFATLNTIFKKWVEVNKVTEGFEEIQVSRWSAKIPSENEKLVLKKEVIHRIRREDLL